MPDPGNGHLTMVQLGKGRTFLLAGAAGQQSFPDHLVEKCPGIEMFRGSEIFERPWHMPLGEAWPL